MPVMEFFRGPGFSQAYKTNVSSMKLERHEKWNVWSMECPKHIKWSVPSISHIMKCRLHPYFSTYYNLWGCPVSRRRSSTLTQVVAVELTPLMECQCPTCVCLGHSMPHTLHSACLSHFMLETSCFHAWENIFRKYCSSRPSVKKNHKIPKK